MEEDYQLVSAADAVLNEHKDLKDIVVNQRADKEDDSDDQENRRESSERGTAHPQSQSHPRTQPAEQKPAKGLKRSRGRSGSMHPQPPSPARLPQLDPATQPHPAQPESDRHMSEQPQLATAASHRSPQHAAATRDMPNGHAQTSARQPQSLAPIAPPQTTLLDTQTRETRMCSWCPTAAVLASG